MKSEAQTNVVFWSYNQLSIPSFRRSAVENNDMDEMSKLEVENARLQQLVAELLIANQHLRRQYSDAKGSAGHEEPSAASNSYRRDN